MMDELLKQFDDFADEKKREYMSAGNPALAAHMMYIQLTLHNMAVKVGNGEQLSWNNSKQEQESYTA